MDEIIDAQEEKPQVTAAEAEEVLKKAKQERVNSCGRAIEAVLKEHECNLIGIPTYVQTSNGWVTSITYKIDPK